MINLDNLKKIKRVREVDNRNFKLGIRSDRNEKVENWSLNIFKKVFKNIKPHEFTAYYNTKKLETLESKISKFLKIRKENFVINHGGDGVIKEFLLVNHRKNLKVIINSDNYGMYKVYFKGLKIKFFEVPYKVNLNEKNLFRLDLKYFYKNLKKSDIIFFTSPNVVSNFDLKKKDLEKLCKKYPRKFFFIDESYYGFGHFSFIKLAKNYKNLFVLRSITKTFGLASARIGFLISHKDSIKPYKALQTPYPVSLFSGKCLEFFLENIRMVNSYNRKVIEGRESFCKILKKKNYLINNGKGLSILVYFNSKKRLKKIYNLLLKKKIYTKKVQVNSKNFLRITCGPKKIMLKIANYFN